MRGTPRRSSCARTAGPAPPDRTNRRPRRRTTWPLHPLTHPIPERHRQRRLDRAGPIHAVRLACSPFTAVLSILLALNAGTVASGICRASPVRGLRPLRAIRRFVVNLPKPTIVTSSPSASASPTTSNTASTASSEAKWLRLVRFATRLATSPLSMRFLPRRSGSSEFVIHVALPTIAAWPIAGPSPLESPDPFGRPPSLDFGASQPRLPVFHGAERPH